MNHPPIHIDRLPSPLGSLLLAHGGGHLCALDFQDYESRFRQYLARRFGHVPVEQRRLPEEILNALQSYLSGELNALKHIPVHASGTRFQQLVWQTLRQIPAGQTWSYAELARAIGQPEAIRAVANANARNPVALVVPCHRVIGSDGSLTGYAGGLPRKHWLLVHEGARDDAAPEKASGKRRLQNHTLPLFGV
ncbi:MAG: methylated-DNA--[protein]-cysteine S-methyltransferase [Moraxellaceae bacterium]